MPGANLNAASDHGHSPLLFAIHRGEPELVGLHLSHGGNPNDRDLRKRWTLLRIAQTGYVAKDP